MPQRFLSAIWFGLLAGAVISPCAAESSAAAPGIRDYLEYGGHGVLVFDINAGHKFIKRLASGGLDEKGHALNVKGICANARTQRLYVTTLRTLMCFDLVSGKLLWEKAYEGGCDRLALSPDGQVIYLP